jgi:hypothetical protein
MLTQFYLKLNVHLCTSVSKMHPTVLLNTQLCRQKQNVYFLIVDQTETSNVRFEVLMAVDMKGDCGLLGCYTVPAALSMRTQSSSEMFITYCQTA